jgi:hypothetical protein
MKSEQQVRDRLAKLHFKSTYSSESEGLVLTARCNELRWLLGEEPQQPRPATTHCNRCHQDDPFCRCAP